MSIFPINTALQEQLDNIKNSVSLNKTSNGKTYLFDFVTGDFVYRDGKLVIATDEEAMKIWIDKVLRTQKNKYEVYKGTDYGVDFDGLLYGNDYHNTFIMSELKGEIIEALLKNPSINTVNITSMIRDKSSLNITVSINGNEAVNINV